MENTKVLIDTLIIIDYVRTKHKEKSLLYKFFRDDYEIFISAITTFEIYNGINPNNIKLIDIIFERIQTISFNNQIAKFSSIIYNELKSENKIIEISDIFIAATAIYKLIPLATLNIKHFNRIRNLILI